MTTTVYGRVRRLVVERGFGFIEGEDHVQYFFHRSACLRFDELAEGSRVRFDPGRSDKGPRAERVEPAS